VRDTPITTKKRGLENQNTKKSAMAPVWDRWYRSKVEKLIGGDWAKKRVKYSEKRGLA